MWKCKHEDWTKLKLPWYQQLKSEYDAALMRSATQNHNKCCFLLAFIFVCVVGTCKCVHMWVETEDDARCLHSSQPALFIACIINVLPMERKSWRMGICSDLAEPLKKLSTQGSLILGNCLLPRVQSKNIRRTSVVSFLVHLTLFISILCISFPQTVAFAYMYCAQQRLWEWQEGIASTWNPIRTPSFVLWTKECGN